MILCICVPTGGVGELDIIALHILGPIRIGKFACGRFNEAPKLSSSASLGV